MGALYQLLQQTGQVYRGGHFIYASWKHGRDYANCRFLGEKEYASELRSFSLELLEKTIAEAQLVVSNSILVIGIKTLGAKMAEVAVDAYNRTHDARLRFATIGYDKLADGSKSYYWDSSNPNIDHLCTPETQVIWMDDLLNLSSTLEHTRDIFEDRSRIMAVAVLFDRSDLTAEDINVPCLISLEKHPMPAYEEGKCPMCEAYKPIADDFGRGSEYKQRHPDYPGGYTQSKDVA